MFPDIPVSNPEQDEFNRFPFSQRVAEIIASRNDSNSIAIGIYGAWGEGKTTVLHFIEKVLEEKADIVCVRFNPWFFKDEEKLLLSFFKTLAEALNKKLTTKSQDIGKWLAKCGEILAPLSLADPTGSVRGSGQVFEKIGNLFSQAELEDNKKRIEKILEDENKKLVIFVDDIDRLDKSEIQSIFKLVKLSAGFRNTVYVLAFDENKVASAISEKYGSGDLEAGRNFLEKIIQVPLNLPQISHSSLQRFSLKCIEKTIKSCGLELTEEDIRRFVKCFSEGLAVQLRTPRVAQRYANTIAFSIPLLKGEVNIVDLLLIEGMKVFYPELYNSIKDKSSYFLGTVLDQGENNSQISKLVIDVIENSINNLSQEAKISSKKLLKELFPRLNGILGNTHYGASWQNKWTEDKRIASLRYFKRYFAYCIPEDDISDQGLNTFLKKLDTATAADIISDIKKLTNSETSSVESFLTEIFRNIDILSSLSAQNLALALCQMGDYFPNPETLSYTTPFKRAGILISDLIQKLDGLNDKIELSSEIIKTAQPIYFATECFRWICLIQRDNETTEDNLFSETELKKIAEVALNRIRNIAQEKSIYIDFPKIASNLFRFWAYWASKQETTQHLKSKFDKNHYDSVEFLKCYIPTVWSMGMEPPYSIGLPHRGMLQKDDYNAIISVIDPDLLIKYLREV